MAAAAAPSHRIHTLHGAFGAHPRYYGPASLNVSPAQASWNRIPNVCAPRRPTYEVQVQVAPVGRTTPASASASGCGSGAGIGGRSRPRRTTMSAGSTSWGPSLPSPNRRAPPPPPAPAERTTSALVSSLSLSAGPAIPSLPTASTADTVPIPEIEDPFADAHELPLSPFPPLSTSTSSMILPTSNRMRTVGTPPGLARTVPSARDVRGRLVATTLLNRGSGRPLGVYLRRRLSGEGAGAGYVKSGLSQLVAAAA